MRTFGTLRKLKNAWILRLTTVRPTSTQKTKKSNRYPGVAQLGARVVWETYPTHSGLFSKTSNTPLTLRIFGLWDFRKNRQKWQRPHSIPQTLKTPQKLNIGMWRSLVSRSLWEREISQVRILSSRPPFLRSLAVPEDFFFFFDYCGSNFETQTSNRHRFLRGGCCLLCLTPSVLI